MSNPTSLTITANITLESGMKITGKAKKWPRVHPRDFWDIVRQVPRGYGFRIYEDETSQRIYAIKDGKCALRWNGKQFVRI